MVNRVNRVKQVNPSGPGAVSGGSGKVAKAQAQRIIEATPEGKASMALLDQVLQERALTDLVGGYLRKSEEELLAEAAQRKKTRAAELDLLKKSKGKDVLIAGVRCTVDFVEGTKVTFRALQELANATQLGPDGALHYRQRIDAAHDRWRGKISRC